MADDDTHPSSFPGGTSLSLLEVYNDAAGDGLAGGSPHMHLVSTEAYIVTGGRGVLQSLDRSGFRETPLAAGSVVWFTPGTIHRAVNHGALTAVVLMSNAGLPEAGDAVMTFPDAHLASAAAYAEAAAIDRPGSDPRALAQARRDLAVAGFLELKTAAEAGDDAPLTAFFDRAAGLVAGRAPGWRGLIERGPLDQARASVEVATRLAAGDAAHLAHGGIQRPRPSGGAIRLGMCGHLTTFDVAEGPVTPRA
ncbi:cupin domain-containing protein [Microbacterium sp. ZXX196]|uniref:cupin domain-containing protein n=1 Tax=Microbacterium sp. ZXX196 TaxID=2609291 RepID=UPI0034D38B8C